MGIFDRFKKPRTEVKLITQTQSKDSWADPYQNTSDYSATDFYPSSFYKSLRREIPPLDLAPIKINQLVGDVYIRAVNERDQPFFDEIMDIKVNGLYGQSGFNIFKYQMFDCAIGNGFAFSETVLNENGSDIAYLKIGNPDMLAFIKGDNGTELGIKTLGADRKFEEPNLIHYLAFDTRDGGLRGYSLFHSLPFVTQILLRIEKAYENTAWRFGDPSYIVQVKSKAAHRLAAVTQDVAGKVSTALQTLNKKKKVGQSMDLVQPMPDDMSLEIDILGGKDAIPTMEIPINAVWDQIYGRTGLPRWMLGGSRKSQGLNETLSEQEADMIATDIKWRRDQFISIIEKIIWIKQVLTKNVGKGYTIEWSQISLRDEKQEAESRKLNSEALNNELMAFASMIDMGILQTDEEINDQLEAMGLSKVKGIRDKVNEYIIRREADRTALQVM